MKLATIIDTRTKEVLVAEKSTFSNAQGVRELNRMITPLIALFIFIVLHFWIAVAYEVPSGLKNRGCHKIYLYPRFVKELLFSIFAYIMSVLFTVMIIAVFLTNIMDNYIGHIGLLIMLSFWLFGKYVFHVSDK